MALEEDIRDVLATVNSGPLAPSKRDWTVGELETALLGRYPRQDAESWDRMGLLVGDANARVTGVCIALDPTVQAVRDCAQKGCNVLLTHHPAFLEPPCKFGPLQGADYGAGSVVYEAIAAGVNLINLHTALDVSADVAQMLPRMLGLQLQGILEKSCPDGRGYGQRCSIRESDEPFTLRKLAARCMAIFGRPARVWGRMDETLDTVVTCTGSAGDLLDICIQKGCSCLVCGETRYHSALAASEAGLAIIELGHDVSELPICAVLAAALLALGYPEAGISILDQSHNWTCPEAIRK